MRNCNNSKKILLRILGGLEVFPRGSAGGFGEGFLPFSDDIGLHFSNVITFRDFQSHPVEPSPCISTVKKTLFHVLHEIS